MEYVPCYTTLELGQKLSLAKVRTMNDIVAGGNLVKSSPDPDLMLCERVDDADGRLINRALS